MLSVATMMSCRLPTPLSIIPKLHSELSVPVHMGLERGPCELLGPAAVITSSAANLDHQDLMAKSNNPEQAGDSAMTDDARKPSKVIHLRNIPNDSTEADIFTLGVPFGRVKNVLVLKGMNQAFIEMADLVCAMSLVTCYNAYPPYLRGRVVYAQFSNHRELKTDQNPSNILVPCEYRIKSQPSAFPLPVRGPPSSNYACNLGTAAAPVAQNNTNSANAGSANASGAFPSTVLRVIVESQLYPVSLDILHQIFKRFGEVLKIIMFTKNNAFQALIQYSDLLEAQQARATLDGQSIYSGCCKLRIDYSKMTNLIVRYNNDKSRDFTNPSLPPGEPGVDIMSTTEGLVNANDLLLIAARQRPATLPVASFGASAVLTPLARGISAPLAGGCSHGLPILGAIALHTITPALLDFSNVLFVSNLNEDMVTPYALFTLFGVYGDVLRVKILYNKKHSALIKMAELHQAYMAMHHLDNLRIWGKPIRVMASKQKAVQLPKEGLPDAGLTCDYSQSPLHRFKKPGSKNYLNIYAPSDTLHLSNIPSICTEEDIKEAFTSNNFVVKAFKFFRKDHKMALMQLPTIEEAVLALIKMHNHRLAETSYLRVSFSKMKI